MGKIGEIIHWSRNHIEGLLSDEVKVAYDFTLKGIRLRQGIYLGILDTRHIPRNRRDTLSGGHIDSRIEYHLNAVKFHSMVLGNTLKKRARLREKYEKS